MSQELSRALYIGRFQPFTNAHLAIVTYIASFSEVDELIIGIGSSQFDYRNASILGGPLENPFTYEERKEMIESSLEGILKPIIIMGFQDLFDCELWRNYIIETAPKFKYFFNNKKNESELFSQANIEIRPIAVPVDLNLKAGPIRRKIIAGDQNYRTLLPQGTLKVLDRINAEERMRKLCPPKVI